MQVRERIKRERDDRMTLKEKFRQQKGSFSSGKVFNLGLSQIGKKVFDRVNHCTIESRQVSHAKGEAACVVLVEKVVAEKYIKALGITPDKFTVAQLKILLGALKLDGDRKIPIKKGELMQQLVEWEEKRPLSVKEEVSIVTDTA